MKDSSQAFSFGGKMYAVSADYKSQINKTVRNISHLKVTFGIIDTDATGASSVSSDGETFYSNTSDVTDLTESTVKYMTMEHNRFVLDGLNILCPEVSEPTPEYQGYYSTEISNANGYFSATPLTSGVSDFFTFLGFSSLNAPTFDAPHTNPILTVDFSSPQQLIGISFVFDSVMGSYPEQLIIRAYDGATLRYSRLATPTAPDFFLDEPIPASPYVCDRIELEFVKSFPSKRRASLEQLVFGIVRTFTDEQITDATWTRETDMLSSKLPRNEFQFTILDVDNEYNPENPDSSWKYLEATQPLFFEYGYDLDNGSIEWIKGSNTFTTGENSISTDNTLSKVTIRSVSKLSQLDKTYYYGKYNPLGESLYDLAVAVLSDAGVSNYVIDSALQSIYTTNFVPEMSHRDALQLIANAGMAVLSTNRDGFITITQFDPVTLQDFKFDYSNIRNVPTVTKSPYLTSVDTFWNQVDDGGSVATVHDSEFSTTGDEQFLLKYNSPCSSSNMTITTTGTLVVVGTPVFYANCCELTLNGTGRLMLTGSVLNTTKKEVSYVVGTTGFNCPIENSLITSEAHATAYATWVADILQRKNQYNITDRGYPEVDMMDNVLVDVAYRTDAEATVYYNVLNYNGALSGQTKYITKEI